ncbi:MAG: YezD family protein [Candidatus Omnitrophica bacterium]|nr:YezD family protein [Candidatus Omnitrophota bacterium]
MKQKEKLTPKVLDEIVSSVNRINYGEVVITIHDSKIVPIERKD